MSEYESIKIMQFKLASGEDIVAYLQSSEEAGYIVERPVKVKYDNSKEGYWMTNWMTMSEFKTPVLLNYWTVIAVSECTEVVKETYVKTVIQTPTTQAEPEVDTDLYDEVEDQPKVIH